MTRRVDQPPPRPDLRTSEMEDGLRLSLRSQSQPHRTENRDWLVTVKTGAIRVLSSLRSVSPKDLVTHTVGSRTETVRRSGVYVLKPTPRRNPYLTTDSVR